MLYYAELSVKLSGRRSSSTILQ